MTFEDNEEAETVFAMLDKDLNGDLSMDELEAVLVEIGRERKAITSSLKDLDSVVSRLGNVLDVFVIIITLMVFLSLISTSTSGVLTSAGSTILALSWLLHFQRSPHKASLFSLIPLPPLPNHLVLLSLH